MGAKVEAVLAALNVRFDPEPKGGWLWGHCPFHDDKDPSWRIRVTAFRYGQHHCFSCKAGGTLAALVSYVKKIDYDEAQAWLDGLEQIPVEQEEVRSEGEVEFLPGLGRGTSFMMPREVIFESFDRWVSPARRYLEGRHVTPEQVAMFRIGYAVNGRLDGRILLTTWAHGHPCSYMARDFTKDRNRKRYLYPMASEHPNLDVMFGEHLWSSDRECVVVTEGALNALAWARAGAPSIAALGGSDVRPMHALKLASFRRVLIATDNDPAGDIAAASLSNALIHHTKTQRIRLPADADELPVDTLRVIIATFYAAVN